MLLRSPAFDRADPIPAQYTCQGQDVSPELYWEEAPEGTKSFALLVEDPDAPSGVWTHWLVFNIPADVHKIEHDGLDAANANGITQGTNDFGKIGYGGPCPPEGHGKHRYIFRLFALDTTLDLGSDAKKVDLVDAIEGHVIDEAQIYGVFERKEKPYSSH